MAGWFLSFGKCCNVFRSFHYIVKGGNSELLLPAEVII